MATERGIKMAKWRKERMAKVNMARLWDIRPRVFAGAFTRAGNSTLKFFRPLFLVTPKSNFCTQGFSVVMRVFWSYCPLVHQNENPDMYPKSWIQPGIPRKAIGRASKWEQEILMITIDNDNGAPKQCWYLLLQSNEIQLKIPVLGPIRSDR